MNVIIIIITHKEKLNLYETISIQQCFSVLGAYQIVFLVPHSLPIKYYRDTFGSTANFDYVDERWLESYQQFNRFKISLELYQRYRDFEYILFYEPDAFVFKDELSDWCEKGYSYIGAPWIDEIKKYDTTPTFAGVGNGGFSLRKVVDQIQALMQWRPIWTPGQLLNEFPGASTLGKLKLLAMTYPQSVLTGQWFHHHLNRWPLNEDKFWHLAAKHLPGYSIPTELEAITFSIEKMPRQLFALNKNRLPFGTHGWWKHDLAFWKPFIESFGYDLSNPGAGN